MGNQNTKQRGPLPMRRHGGGMMSGPTEKAKNFKGALSKLISHLKPHWLKLILVLILAILSTVFAVASPKILGNMTNQIFEDLTVTTQTHTPLSIQFDVLQNLAGILLVLFVLSSLFNFLQGWIITSISQKISYEFRKKISKKIDKLPLKYFDTKSQGDILSRVTNDVDTVSQTLDRGLSQMIISLTTVLGILGMMLSISPLLTLVALITLPLSFVSIGIVMKTSQKHFISQQRLLGKLNGHVEEMYGGHTVIKAFNAEEHSKKTFEKINGDLSNTARKAQFLSGLMWPIMDFMSNLGFVLLAIFGGYLSINGKVKIGDIQAFIQYVRRFNQPILQLANISNVMQSTVAAAERVFEFLDEEEEIPNKQNSKKLTSPKGSVEFQNVVFGYNTKSPVIKNLSLSVSPGQKVAIVGPTGAGKTTLVNLLMRFYESDEGSITIDGIDIKEMKRQDLRSLFGMVLQDTWLFHDTLEANIRFGHQHATHDELIKSTKATHADHYIRSLPDGYMHKMDEESDNISGGEKQLITISRAMLANPPMLILDEATSSVDTRTEVLIQQAMEKLMVGKTSFVIAHRLSTIKNADLILVMNEGNIVEQGTHLELLELNGFYAELYQSQFSGN